MKILKLLALSLFGALIAGSALYVTQSSSTPEVVYAASSEGVEGYFDPIYRGDGAFAYGLGWAIDRNNPSHHVSVIFTDGKIGTGKIVGYANTDQLREDVSRYLGERPGEYRRGFMAELAYTSATTINAYAVLPSGRLLYLGTQAIPSGTPRIEPPVQRAPSIEDHEWVRGNANNPKVVLIEYSDLECPFCRRHHPTMNQVLAEYGDDVAWVYRHFPLTSIHPQAEPAAVAAECVGQQLGDEGFFAFIDAIFERSATEMNDELYFDLAQRLGANVGIYNSCYRNQSTISEVRKDLVSGTDLDVRGTPTTFVNGEPVAGSVPIETLKRYIDAALAE